MSFFSTNSRFKKKRQKRQKDSYKNKRKDLFIIFLIGLGRSRSAADESLLDFIRKANNSANVLYLMDARPQLNAQANTIAGAGYEVGLFRLTHIFL